VQKKRMKTRDRRPTVRWSFIDNEGGKRRRNEEGGTTLCGFTAGE
jgi:hypothetical protein